MQETVDIKRKVLEENEKVHDMAANTHTRSVPYQCRKITRNYIWNLIINQLKLNKVNPNGADVLEVGCGTGTFVDLFNKLGCKSYTGIDISSKMIQIAQRDNKYSYAKFIKSSLDNFAHNNINKYDIIISSSFLHHLYDLEEGITQIRNKLNIGGIYIALHEFIKDRKLTRLEIFDYRFAYLMGYMGGTRTSFWKRLSGFSKSYLNDLKILTKKILPPPIKYKLSKFLKKYKSNKNTPFAALPLNSGPNYVDYQLNFKFNLGNNDIVLKYGHVFPYCYYNFAELMHIKKVNNHNMFVMIKHKNEIWNKWQENFEYNEDMVQRLKNMLCLVDMNEIKSVADLGCGPQYLRDLLNSSGWSGEYVGLDLYKHKESTIVCDFNKNEFPLQEKYDLIIIAGLLEYIDNIEYFFNKVKTVAGKYILFSYIFYELAKKSSNIWMPLASQKALLGKILSNQDFSLLKVMPDPLHPEPNTTLYILLKRTGD